MLVNWFKLTYPHFEIFSIPNGGSRNLIEAIKLKKEGLKKGALDLIVLIPNKIIFLEMKTKKGKVSKDQKIFILKATKLNHLCLVGYGFADAKEKLQRAIETMLD